MEGLSADPKFPPEETPSDEGEYWPDADEEQEEKRIACLPAKLKTIRS